MFYKGDISYKNSYLYEFFTCINKNVYFTKETDTSGYIVV